MITFKPGSSAHPLAAERLASFEARRQLPFPPGYVSLMRAANGGVPVQSCFKHSGRERLIERFLPLCNSVREEPVLGQFDIDVVMGQLGERLVDNEDLDYWNVIPIAALFAGDFLCLDFRTSAEDPNVAVWDHERSEPYKTHLETVAR